MGWRLVVPPGQLATPPNLETTTMLQLPPLNQLAVQINDNAVRHGFWKANTDHGMKLMLMVSELAEALEELRNGRAPREIYANPDRPDKPEGVPIELADAIIRILDYCAHHDIDIEDAIILKMEYNLHREHMHGRTV